MGCEKGLLEAEKHDEQGEDYSCIQDSELLVIFLQLLFPSLIFFS